MNTAQRNNERHQEALSIVDTAVKAGIKIKLAPDNYKVQDWEPPKPKSRK